MRLVYFASMAAVLLGPVQAAHRGLATGNKKEQSDTDKKPQESSSSISDYIKGKEISFQQPTADVVIPSNGDTDAGMVVVLDKSIYGHDRTTVVGHTAGTCTRIVPNVKWHCTGTYEFGLESDSFPTGNAISVMGPYYDSGEVWNSIVGGTGDFKGARGEGHYLQEDDWITVTLYL